MPDMNVFADLALFNVVVNVRPQAFNCCPLVVTIIIIQIVLCVRDVGCH